MQWSGTAWNVYYLNDDDKEVLWCACKDMDAVRPGRHTWEMFEGGSSHMCEFETVLGN